VRLLWQRSLQRLRPSALLLLLLVVVVIQGTTLQQHGRHI
jgi:hypothetical protein